MDRSIKKINEYRLYATVDNSPVVVKKSSNSTNIIQYVVCGCSQEESKTIIQKRELTESIKRILFLQDIIKEESNIVGLIFCGKLENFGSPSKLVYKYPQRKIDIRNRVEPQYRFYLFTKEQQEKHRLVHNICPTVEHSWNSVITKVGSQYGIILKIKLMK